MGHRVLRYFIAAIVPVAAAFLLIGRVLVSETSPTRNLSTLSELADPKSVEHKRTGLRVLSFGTSQTWGAFLPKRTEQAYPWILSPNANNQAIRATGPGYPSMCTESMVGEELYDVITLEFNGYNIVGPVDTMVRRLRRRFPDAIIVLISYWYPLQINVKEDGVEKGLGEWAKDNGGLKLHSKEFPEAFQNTQEAFYNPLISFFDETLTKAAHGVGGHVYRLPKPDTPKEAMKQISNLWIHDFNHFSVDGHAEVAHGVGEIVQKALEWYPTEPRLGSWGNGDDCKSWFQTGDCPLSRTSMTMKPISESGDKYALEVDANGGTLTVNNPFDGPRALHLGYMVIGPPPSKYPNAQITVGSSEPVLLEQISPYPFPTHVTNTIKVGTIGPGETVLTFQPIEEGKELPFRVVSTAVVSDSKISLRVFEGA